MRTLDISKTYLKFFISNADSRYLLIQGSRRSGKSFSVYKWLYFLSLGKERENNLVVCASYPALQNAVSDFQRATGAVVENSQLLGYHADLPNGSRFSFKAFDDYTKAQGVSCTRLYLEEALNIDEQIITTLSMSAEKQIYFCYNPTKKSHIDRYINSDRSNWLKTTYLDNKWLPESQVSEFELIKSKALAPTATVLDRYAYQVYVLGEFSSMAGKVFREIYACTPEEYDNVRATEYFGLDFGFVENSDQTAVVGIKRAGNTLYARELIYSQTLTKDYDLAWAMAEAGISPYDWVFADYGGMGKTRINALAGACSNGEQWVEEPINRGFQIYNAQKGAILDGVRAILNFERLVVVDGSENLRGQLDGYELDEAGKPTGKTEKNNHLVDALRYAVNSTKDYR